MKILSFSVLGLMLMGMLASDAMAQDRGRDRDRGNDRGIEHQLDRIERKIDRLLLGDQRPGFPVDVLRSEVSLECLGDLVTWNTDFDERVSIAQSVCRNTNADIIQHCRLVASENNRDCFAALDNWTYDGEQKARLVEACRTEIYECR